MTERRPSFIVVLFFSLPIYILSTKAAELAFGKETYITILSWLGLFVVANCICTLVRICLTKEPEGKDVKLER